MKKILYIIPLLFFANIANAGFVVDHTSTNLDDIPDEWVTRVKEDIHGAYNHTSHGSQLITGMNALEDFPNFGSDYAWTDTTSGDSTSLSLDDGGMPGEVDLSQGDKDSDSDGIADWAEDTYTFLDNSSNNHVNVIMWSWCNISGHDIDRYIRSMEWLLAQFSEDGSAYTDDVMTIPASPHNRAVEHPVKFVFMTAHANGGGEGDSSDIPNEQIRSHVQTYDRILFDFSDIENYDPDENYYLDKLLQDDLDYDSDNSGLVDSNWASEYLTLYNDQELDQLTHGEGIVGYNGAGSCAHSDGPNNDARLNCVLKGRAAWYLFARLAGWEEDVDVPTPEPTKDSLYRFWSEKNKSHFYTASESEKDYIIAHYDDYVWKYERIANDVFKTQVTNSTPVYRFWSDTHKGHFYTASESEKDYIIANYDTVIWKYEGIAYYVYPTQQSNTKPVYRFWSAKNKHHFYTASEAEKEYVIANYDDYTWKYEGRAWYVAE